MILFIKKFSALAPLFCASTIFAAPIKAIPNSELFQPLSLNSKTFKVETKSFRISKSGLIELLENKKNRKAAPLKEKINAKEKDES